MTTTILVADDNRINRQLVRYALEHLGYAVLEAEDGAEAVRIACAQRPQMILMDWRMPVMGGLDATRELKCNAATRDIPVVAVTANALDGDKELALQAGCHDHCTKPINLARLEELVRQHCAP
jgi:CheY-like chemotaxis protein